MAWAKLIVFVCLTAGSSLIFHAFLRIAKRLYGLSRVKGTPVSPIASADGWACLSGTALAHVKLSDPVYGAPCFWWRLVFQRWNDEDDWWTAKEAVAPEPFLLQDATGKILVDPSGAEYEPPPGREDTIRITAENLDEMKRVMRGFGVRLWGWRLGPVNIIEAMRLKLATLNAPAPVRVWGRVEGGIIHPDYVSFAEETGFPTWPPLTQYSLSGALFGAIMIALVSWAAVNMKLFDGAWAAAVCGFAIGWLAS